MSSNALKLESVAGEASLREQILSEMVKPDNKAGSRKLKYKSSTKVFDAYAFPIEHLVFNKYNGRIASKVKSFETQFGNLNPLTIEGRDKICEFLWEASEKSNRKTKASLLDNEQLEVGIITKDGVIIDGNRRASLILDLAKDGKMPAFFNAVILPDRLDSNKKEIMRLETEYQIGEDKKVEYNAIEKYLKCKDLKEVAEFSIPEIREFMGEDNDNVIKENLEIMDLMDEYLKSIDCAGMYTLLDNTEAVFVDFLPALKRFSGTAGQGRNQLQWDPAKDDIDDLKSIVFDVIRARFRGGEGGKGYRTIFANKETSIFTNQKVWKKFTDNHFDKIDPIKNQEQTIEEIRKNNKAEDFEKVLLARDVIFGKQAGGRIQGNINIASEEINDLSNERMPEKLLTKALNALESIDLGYLASLDNDKDADLKLFIKDNALKISKLAGKIKLEVE